MKHIDRVCGLKQANVLAENMEGTQKEIELSNNDNGKKGQGRRGTKTGKEMNES